MLASDHELDLASLCDLNVGDLDGRADDGARAGQPDLGRPREAGQCGDVEMRGQDKR